MSCILKNQMIAKCKLRSVFKMYVTILGKEIHFC